MRIKLDVRRKHRCLGKKYLKRKKDEKKKT